MNAITKTERGEGKSWYKLEVEADLLCSLFSTKP